MRGYAARDARDSGDAHGDDLFMLLLPREAARRRRDARRGNYASAVRSMLRWSTHAAQDSMLPCVDDVESLFERERGIRFVAVALVRYAAALITC